MSLSLRVFSSALCGMFVFLFVGGPLAADDSKGIAKNPMIKNLVGEWEAKGELTGPDGSTYTITEQWTGAVVSENTLAIEGKREINGGQSDFKWTIILNADTGVYEATHVIDNNQTQRFEGSFSEETHTMELISPLDGGGTMKLVRVFTSEDYNTFDTEVTFTNEKGEVTIRGKLVSKRVKKS
ncbi:DUF1579 domain-containing protein [Roseimicrobium sp. ORNL1]|uniref:DUF1579 domain-containing protein n=1 Tax=Roseimicrobium sp. ORNL1 TaxID=2711231 RepID=UPI0013E18331|nr:DUF1579 domain-containing protein [Roseimicrobium sp. ORNL1]QIF03669.1 DUF1579 domain-containing protein [Roseimicrobium sp. ORNL1]